MELSQAVEAILWYIETGNGVKRNDIRTHFQKEHGIASTDVDMILNILEAGRVVETIIRVIKT